MDKLVYNSYHEVPDHLKEIAVSKDSGCDESGRFINWYEVTETSAARAGLSATYEFYCDIELGKYDAKFSAAIRHIKEMEADIKLSEVLYGDDGTSSLAAEMVKGLSTDDKHQQTLEEEAENEGMVMSIDGVTVQPNAWIGGYDTTEPKNDRMKELKDKYYQQLCDILKEVNNKFFDDLKANEFSADDIIEKFEKIREIARK